MSQKQSISVNGRMIVVGTVLTATNNFSHLPRGAKVSVKKIRRNEDGIEIGVCAEKRVDGWHNLDGSCPDRCGYWIEPRHIKKSFKVSPDCRIVRGNVSFKDKSLQGMECSVLSHLPKGKVFVELVEDVGGASCDGLGKKGHCVVLKKENIGTAPKKLKQKEREV